MGRICDDKNVREWKYASDLHIGGISRQYQVSFMCEFEA